MRASSVVALLLAAAMADVASADVQLRAHIRGQRSAGDGHGAGALAPGRTQRAQAALIAPAASVVSGQGPAADYAKAAQTSWMVSWAITLLIFGVSSYFVYKWHNEYTEMGVKTKFCGIKSVLCCLCCTFITICFPIDEDYSE